jgi:hypothetical protein
MIRSICLFYFGYSIILLVRPSVKFEKVRIRGLRAVSHSFLGIEALDMKLMATLMRLAGSKQTVTPPLARSLD